MRSIGTRSCAKSSTQSAGNWTRSWVPRDKEHMRDVISSVETEFQKYKALAENAMTQLDDAQLAVTAAATQSNSVAVLVWHVSGNLTARFTDFLTSDGEKPWRHRDEEFVRRQVSRGEMMEKWERGWKVLFDSLATLTDADLGRQVTIRKEPCRVIDALHRALAHISYHVGQIVLLAKNARGNDWHNLSVPLGQSEAFNSRFGKS